MGGGGGCVGGGGGCVGGGGGCVGDGACVGGGGGGGGSDVFSPSKRLQARVAITRSAAASPIRRYFISLLSLLDLETKQTQTAARAGCRRAAPPGHPTREGCPILPHSDAIVR
ncbi:MAG TPA: hypothetical protein EYP77_07530 [Anaerolineae bacterium]|nr:hypothetical protein [Anaerolineae bacterium]